MNREKAVNLAWVMILVPMVLSIFKLIRYAGFQEAENWPVMMALIAVGMIAMLFVPKVTRLVYDRFSRKAT